MHKKKMQSQGAEFNRWDGRDTLTSNLSRESTFTKAAAIYIAQASFTKPSTN